MFLDADTHVDECVDTWARMPEEMMPTTLLFDPEQVPIWLRPHDSGSSVQTRMWFIDGQVHSHRFRDNKKTGTTEGTRELYDVDRRLKDMDELGVDVQSLYPTLFLHEVTQRPELDLALCQSYNRWLASRCAESGGRLRWIALPPLGTIPEAVEELRFAKENGAVGVFKRGVEWGRSVSDPYFYPLYHEAQDLELPLCIHSSLPWSAVEQHFARVRPPLRFGNMTVLQAFQDLVGQKIQARFPRLKFGFIEAGSAWLPYLLDLAKINDGEGFLAESRFYVTCEVSEDISYVIDKVGGDDNLIVGTDYTHGDRASVIDAHRNVMNRQDMTEESARKITSENARAFYGLY